MLQVNLIHAVGRHKIFKYGGRLWIWSLLWMSEGFRISLAQDCKVKNNWISDSGAKSDMKSNLKLPSHLNSVKNVWEGLQLTENVFHLISIHQVHHQFFPSSYNSLSFHYLLCLCHKPFFTALRASCCSQRLPLTLATTKPCQFTLTIASPCYC